MQHMEHPVGQAYTAHALQALLQQGDSVRVPLRGESMGWEDQQVTAVTVDPADTHPGQVVIFARDGRLVCHRLLASSRRGQQDGFWEGGDAHASLGHVRRRDIIARVVTTGGGPAGLHGLSAGPTTALALLSMVRTQMRPLLELPPALVTRVALRSLWRAGWRLRRRFS
jgi:hypothetical protein